MEEKSQDLNLEEKIYKNHFKKFLVKVEKKLFTLTGDNNKSGFLVYLLHVVVYIFTLVYLFTGKIDGLFYFCLVFWIAIFITHFCLGGCIFTKVERHLWDTKNWNGAWTFLFLPIENHLANSLSKNFKENIYICWGIIISALLLLKIVFYN